MSGRGIRIAGTGARELVRDPILMDRVIKFLAGRIRRAESLGFDPAKIIFGCGMAEGFDEALAKACIATDSRWIAYIPHPGYCQYYWQNNSYTGRSRGAEFEELLAQAEATIYVCSTIYGEWEGKKTHSNFLRNYKMIGDAQRVWAWDPKSRGTRHAVEYAISLERPIWQVELPSLETV